MKHSGERENPAKLAWDDQRQPRTVRMRRWSTRLYITASVVLVIAFAVTLLSEDTDALLCGYLLVVVCLLVAWVLRMRSDPVYDYKRIPSDGDLEDDTPG
jgi:Flp pilus assembly protein TadB